MEELIQLLQQIQELAGVGIEALSNAAGGAGGSAPPAEAGGVPPAEGAPPVG